MGRRGARGVGIGGREGGGKKRRVGGGRGGDGEEEEEGEGGRGREEEKGRRDRTGMGGKKEGGVCPLPPPQSASIINCI